MRRSHSHADAGVKEESNFTVSVYAYNELAIYYGLSGDQSDICPLPCVWNSHRDGLG